MSPGEHSPDGPAPPAREAAGENPRAERRRAELQQRLQAAALRERQEAPARPQFKPVWVVHGPRYTAPRRFALGRSARIWLGLGALLLLVAALGQWLSQSGGESDARRLEIALIDVSSSLTAGRPGALAWLRQALLAAAERAEAEGALMELWAYSSGSRKLVAAEPAAELRARLLGSRGAAPLLLRPLDLDPEGSDLGLALETLARALEGAGLTRVPRRLSIFGDGLAGGERASLEARLGHWSAAGIELHFEAAPPAELSCARLDGLSGPREAAAGEMLSFSVAYSLADPLPDELWLAGRCVAPGRRPVPIAAQPLPRRSGLQSERVEIAAALDPPCEFEFWLSGADPASGAAAKATPALEVLGDSATALVRARGRRLVGFVGPEQRAVGTPRPAPEWIDWLPLTPSSAAARLADLDALVWWDRPLGELPTGVEAFLEQGGGLLTLGGASQLVSADRAPRLGFVPLLAAPTPGPPRDLVVLFDGSGSMAGAPAEAVKQAALRLAEILPAEDGLVLRWFTEALAAPMRLPSGNRQASAEALLRMRAPGGGTALYYSLEQYVRERELAVAAGVRSDELVILLSDGRDVTPPDDPPLRAAGLRARLAAARSELKVIAIGERADLELLTPLAGGPEALLQSPTPNQLEALLLRLGAGERWLPGPIPVLTQGTRWLAAEALGLSRERPPLDQALKAWLTPGSEAFWLAPSGAPLGAVTGVGAGRSVALAFAPGTECATDWLGREDLLPLLAFVAERPEQTAARLCCLDGRLLLEAPGSGWPARLPAQLVPQIPGPELPETLEFLTQGPDQWQARLGGRWLARDRLVSLEVRLDPRFAPGAGGLPWISARPPREPLAGVPLGIGSASATQVLEPGGPQMPAGGQARPARSSAAAAGSAPSSAAGDRLAPPPFQLARPTQEPPAWSWAVLLAGLLALALAAVLSLGQGQGLPIQSGKAEGRSP
jgi:hypothetical protein